MKLGKVIKLLKILNAHPPVPAMKMPPIRPKQQKVQVVGVCRIGHHNQQISDPLALYVRIHQ